MGLDNDAVLLTDKKIHKSGKTFQWRHNDRDGGSNYRRLDGLLNRLFRRRSKKTSKLWLLWGEFTGHRWVPLTKRPVTRKMFPVDDMAVERDVLMA